MEAHPVNKMIDLLWSPPRGVQRQHRSRKHPDNFQYYHQWGFPIYRTYYGPESDKHWNMLLGALKHQTRLAFGFFEDEEDVEEEVDQGDVQRLKELFHLDTREDASLLDGLDVRDIWALCQNEEVDKQRAMADRVFRFVLLADRSVFKDIERGEFIVKAISLDWREGFRGWGWMRIPTGYLLDLWQTLMLSSYHTERVLSFNGPEQDLEGYVWPGELSIEPTGVCSEVRRLCFHYSGQSPDRTN
ncbi:hypothetical protein CDV31_014409 [Fusarium ambrosium]|uniref:Uncharacterized protein n=1 Tax=Fusarium ambrosium TaxID=131363 RepID=A0A428SWP6_9HYPO|nr:hypothetical protein CDV31_014409 [Fusarium ambrosium]